MKKAKPTAHSKTFYEARLRPDSPVRADQVTTYSTLGAFLRKTRLNRKLSLRRAASNAGLSPMYLSLLERDACGPPSDEKLESLAKVLEDPNLANLFAKAGRVTPRVSKIILQHPTQWSELLHACEHLEADDLSKLKETIVAGTPGTGKTYAFLESVAANIQKGSAATRRAQLEEIVEAAEKEERIQRTSDFKNRAVLAGIDLAQVRHELTGRESKLKRPANKFDSSIRPKNRAWGEPAYRSGLQSTVASKTTEK
jgi:transcriptional regulator with XRE-family HTH domain